MNTTMGLGWYPAGTRPSYGRPEPGDVIAWEFRVWLVLEVNDKPEEDWTDAERRAAPAASHVTGLSSARRPYIVALRPVELGADSLDYTQDVYLAAGGHRQVEWRVYEDPEHYPVCGCCGGPTPCRYVMARAAGKRAVATMSRYEVEGVCPACQEPVTGRQGSLTWSENLEVLGGPPVTFHLRARCWGSAQAYERRWVAADPGRRRARLSCTGHLTNHNDGTYECTEGAECAGPGAGHPVRRRCDDPDCHARGLFGCNPARDARRRD